MALTLRCFGGVGSVTGSNFMLSGPFGDMLIDCGLIQGANECQEENYQMFPFDPASIKALFVTHAHLDHIGRIPKLVAEGFSGVIYSTQATAEIAPLMFEDALGIFEQEEKQRNKQPLYDRAAVAKTVSLWKSIPYHQETPIVSGLSVYLHDAGHILGSAMIEFRYEGKNIVFTGDLGNSPAPLLRETDPITDATYLIMESVYGDKNHEPKEERDIRFATIVRETIARKGAVVIPAFSLERSQNILYLLNDLIESGEIPSVPVFFDSPLAIRVTEVYRRHFADFNERARARIGGGDDIFRFPKLSVTTTGRESEEIERTPNPKIILAGSGMSAGGRITRHEIDHLPDPNSTILLVGYQSVGTIGRKLEEGVSDIVINGVKVKVRARIENIRGFSSHKDSNGLVDFVSGISSSVKKVFVAMGEPKASLFLVQRLRDELDISALYPERDTIYTLD